MKYTVEIPFEKRNDVRFVREKIEENIALAYEDGGGAVYLPAGEYTTCMIHLKSDVRFVMDDACVVNLCTDLNEYGDRTVPEENFSPDFFRNPEYFSLFLINECHHTGIIGGTVNGFGKSFWTPKSPDELGDSSDHTAILYNAKPNRPLLFRIQHSSDVYLEHITMNDAPVYSVFAIGSSHLSFRHNRVINDFTGPNTDGFHISSCTDTKIEFCDFVTGDDAIAFDSDTFGAADGLFVDHCTFHTSVNVIRIYCGIELPENGRFADCSVRNVVLSHCMVTEASGLINVTAQNGIIENVSVFDLEACQTLEGVPFYLMTFENGKINHLLFHNIRITSANGIATLIGREHARISDITFAHCDIVCSPKNKKYDIGFPEEIEIYWLHHYAPCNLFVRHCDRIVFDDFTVRWKENPNFHKTFPARYLLDCHHIDFKDTVIPAYLNGELQQISDYSDINN